MSTVLNPLERLMAEAGITTILELCDRSGVSRATVYRLTGGGGATLQTLTKLADALGTTTRELDRVAAEFQQDAAA